MLMKTSVYSLFEQGIDIEEIYNQIKLPNFGKNIQMMFCLQGFCVGTLCGKALKEFSVEFMSEDSVQ